jgi:hypothetical protein
LRRRPGDRAERPPPTPRQAAGGSALSVSERAATELEQLPCVRRHRQQAILERCSQCAQRGRCLPLPRCRQTSASRAHLDLPSRSRPSLPRRRSLPAAVPERVRYPFPWERAAEAGTRVDS